MSDEQQQWFFQELSDFNNWDLVVWVSSRPWIGREILGDDYWGGYATERKTIANYIADNSINNLIMISGDAHMLAIDDGSNSDYSDNGGAGFPVFIAAALDRWGSNKGGPFSHGCYSYTAYWVEQFGIMEVTYPSPNSTCLTWSGYRTLSETETQLIVSYSTCTPTVKKGSPGAVDCQSDILPLFIWLRVGLVGAFAVIVVILFLGCFCREDERIREGHVRRILVLSTYFIIVGSNVIITMATFMNNKSKPAKPTLLPYDLAWAVLGLTGLLVIYFIYELYERKKENEVESFGDEEYKMINPSNK